MMPVPATLTSYLPVLLVSVTNPVPDDSAFETQPEGQVDYLSHNWKEEDVWRSWRSMTRQKNAIANGMRLENASWRTWWKQRNKLKTISPETLNWLKDSDVTWLYGPLHLGTDWQQMAHHVPPSPCPQRQGSMECTGGSRSATPSGKKPILKHRSIADMLSLPASPLFHNESDDDANDDSAHHSDEPEEHQSRPPLMHTKSDTHISWRSRQFRKDSPPRIIAADPQADSDHLNATASSSSSHTGGSDQDLNAGSSAEIPGVGKRKHISFNTFVEQYIAIEKPKVKRRGSSTQFVHDDSFDEGYDEDSELGDEDESDEPASLYMSHNGGMDTDSEDDEDEDDEVLEMRSRRSRSSSSSGSRRSVMRTLSPSSATPRRPPLIRQTSMDRERVTIAPIAPTILKTSGAGNQLDSIGEAGTSSSSEKEVELVYVPPSNSIYSHPGTPSAPHEVPHEDVYHHRESYFSVGTGSATSHSRSADSSPVMGSFSLPSVRSPARQVSHSRDLQQYFAQQPVFESPMHADDVREEDAYDYFGGPDLGEEYHRRPRSVRHPRRSFSETHDDGGHGMVRYGHGGASSVPTGRHSGSWSSPVSSSPRIVVNEVAGATEEREECSTGSSGSPSDLTRELPIPRIPADTKSDADVPLAVSFIHNGPAIPVPVPRIVTHSSSAPSSPPESAFLSPTEAALPPRGRSPQCSPVSTTTGSFSVSSDSRSESRGRSSTRNSSFSDRERSGSRSSRGTNSPMGSISPTGSAVGIGGYAQVRGRDRESRTGQTHRRGSLNGDEVRGRDRVGRKIGDSLSPPSLIGSPSRATSDDYPAYSLVAEAKPASSSSASVSGSSVSGSSTASVATITAAPGNGEVVLPAKAAGASSRPLHLPIPSPIPEEEETRSRQPTPANSPVRALSSPTKASPPPIPQPAPASPPISPGHHHAASSPLQVSPPSKSRPSEPVTSPSEAQAMPSSPVGHPERHTRAASEGVPVLQHPQYPHAQHGTLVGRAAEIVQQARGFLGAIWNAV